MKPVIAPLCALLVLAAAQPVLAEAVSGAPWGSRNGTPCQSLTQKNAPSAAQATAILKCRRDKANESAGELWLMEKASIQVGASMPYAAAYHAWSMQGADTTKPVYPLRGSWTMAMCRNRADLARYSPADAQRNCSETDYQGEGVCWRTTFGDWDCTVTGRTGAQRQKTAPPQ